MEILDAMDIEIHEKCKNPNKNARMDVWEALEDGTLESHSRSRGFERCRSPRPQNEPCGSFRFKSAAIGLDRMQGLTIEVGRSSVSPPHNA